MALVLHLTISVAFAALMVAAAFEDFRRLAIPNRLIVGLLLLWPVDAAIGPALTLRTGLATAGDALAVFLCGALLFSLRLVGGGDVKLLTAAALWAGAAKLPILLLLTGVLGGALSLLCLTGVGRRIGAARRPAFVPRETIARAATPVPYGVAIAGAALVVTLPMA
jgi:prepilin peptidase CpaA